MGWWEVLYWMGLVGGSVHDGLVAVSVLDGLVGL